MQFSSRSRFKLCAKDRLSRILYIVRFYDIGGYESNSPDFLIIWEDWVFDRPGTGPRLRASLEMVPRSQPQRQEHSFESIDTPDQRYTGTRVHIFVTVT